MIGSPSPSHPTVRAVFPHTAVRQSSFHGMPRRFLIPDHPAANVEDTSGIQGTIRRAFPSKPSAFPATGQGASKASIDASLQRPKGIAGMRVARGVDPSPHDRMHLLHKVLRRTGGAPFGAGLAALTTATWRRFTGKDIDRMLSAGGASPLHEVEPEAVKAIRQFRDARLVAVDRSSHPRRGRDKRLERLRRACATDDDGIIGVAIQRGAQLLRRAALLPPLVQEGQGDVAVER